MIPLTLRLRNFLPYQDTEVDLRDLHVAALVGPNGAGKSSILEALTWALWGQARSRSDDELIRQGAEDMIVEVTFKAQEKEYRVERRRVRGKRSYLLLFGPGGEILTGASIASTEAFICALLRMDYDTFVNTAFFAQGKADVFTQAQPAHRQEVLAAILGLERYQELSDVCRRRALDLTTELAAARGAEETLEAQASKLGHCRARLLTAREEVARAADELLAASEAQSALAQQLADAVAKAAEQSALRSQVDVYQHEYDRFETDREEKKKELADLQEKAAALPGLEARLEPNENVEEEVAALEEEIRDLPELRQRYGEARGRWQAEVDAKQQQAKRYLGLATLAEGEENMPCPTCLQPLTPAAAKALFEQGSQLDREVEAAEFVSELEQQIAAKEGLVTTLQDLRRRASGVPELRAQVKAAREAAAKVPDLERLLEDLRKGLLAASNILGVAREQLDAIGDLEGARRSLQDRLTAADAKKRECEEAHTAARDQAAALETEVRLAQEAEEQLRQLRLRVAAQTEEQADYQELGDAFGKRGVQALLVDRALPELESMANELLDRLWSGARVELRTQRASKKDGAQPIETLDVLTTNEAGELPYENCSGGQKFRVDFAVRLALARLLARRADAAMPLLAIDEGFGTQDTEGRKRLLEAIRGVQDDFDLVLVVTHIEEMADSFQRVLTVAAGPDGPSVTRR